MYVEGGLFDEILATLSWNTANIVRAHVDLLKGWGGFEEVVSYYRGHPLSSGSTL